MQVKHSQSSVRARFLLILWILCSFWLSSCSPSPDNRQPTPTSTRGPSRLESSPTHQATLQFTEAAGMPTQPAPPPAIMLPAYELNVRYDYAKQTAQIQETITYTNPTPFSLSEMILAVDPLRYPGTFVLESIAINQAAYPHADIGPSWIKLPLTEALQPGDSLSIEIIYSLNLPSITNPQPDQKPSIFGYTILQTNFVDWYPFIPPLADDGEWLLHDGWFFGEYLVYDLADFSVQISVENAPENGMIAASAVPATTAQNSYRYEHAGARNFVWSFSPSFIVKTETVNGIEISSYFFSFHQNAGEQALTETAKAVALYEELFGPYLHQSLAVVEADFLDGMEYDGLYFLSKGFYNLYDGSPQGYLTTIAVHETAHQWWYTKVANDQAMQPWLDEALCTYSEYIFYENLYPELTDWWWDYRVNYYQPSGKIDLPIYDYPGFIPYRDATYLQGANFLHQLRSTLGDETFFAFLKTYANMYAGQISSTASFWQLVERVTRNDTAALKESYFQNND